MRSRRLIAATTVLMLAACGGGGGTVEDTTGGADSAAAAGVVGAGATDPATGLPQGTVDTAGVGVNPPTAGGQLVDTAAVPGPTDTVAGTPTHP